MTFPPGETNSPLIVNVDRMLSLPFAAPRFQPIARRHAKVFRPASVVQQTELSQREGRDI